jgi:limonene-1,2-epoxide hydrolase
VTTDVYTVQDGQITSQTSTLTEESAASLQAAMASRPSAVVMAYVEAINAGDLEAAMTLCHEEVCANLTPTLLPGFPNLYGGKEDVRAWLADAMAVNLEIETEILSVAGDTVTTRSKVWSDYLQTLNAAPIVVNEVIKVRDGQVWSWNRTIPATSVNKLQEGLVELGIPATITPEPGEVLASTISDIVGVWTGAIAGGSEGPVEFESNGNYHMEGDSGRFWFNESFLWIKTEKEHYAGDSLHSCKKGLIGSYVVYVTQSGDQSVGLRYIPILDPCDLRYSFFEGEIHTPR